MRPLILVLTACLVTLLEGPDTVTGTPRRRHSRRKQRKHVSRSSQSEEFDEENGPKRYNVLFLMADDMRPNLNVYKDIGYPEKPFFPVHTPNLDALAAKSAVFANAFVSHAICGPSRACIFSSRRPDTTRVFTIQNDFRDLNPDMVTLPMHFMNNGYWTEGHGKLLHATADEVAFNKSDYLARDHYYLEESMWYEIPVEEEEEFRPIDHMNADKTIRCLKNVARAKKHHKKKSDAAPFFLAYGTMKPHQPYKIPKRFFDMYPVEDINVPHDLELPENFPPCALKPHAKNLEEYPEFKGKNFYNEEGQFYELGETDLKMVKRAYYAGVSYADWQLGRVLEELEELGLAEDTVIAFSVDHGVHFGEHGHMGKGTNQRVATQIPMMLHIPGVTDRGQVVTEVVESIDLFPTVVEAAGLEAMPKCPEMKLLMEAPDLCTEGKSLLPLLEDNRQESVMKKWKSEAFTQQHGLGIAHGFSIRNEDYRYTEWINGLNRGDYFWYNWRSPLHKEFYDLRTDWFEDKNLALDVSYNSTMEELAKRLHRVMQRYTLKT